jgi:hypothetical protein
MQQNKRRLPDGRTVSVHRNGGVRKVCACPHRVWAKCPHPWHLNFRWKGKAYRLSLDRQLGKRIESKSEALAAADAIRSAIRSGTFGAPPPPDPLPEPSPPPGDRSFEVVGSMFVDACKDRGKVSWQDDASMVKQLMSFTPPWPDAGRLGERPSAPSLNRISKRSSDTSAYSAG